MHARGVFPILILLKIRHRVGVIWRWWVSSDARWVSSDAGGCQVTPGRCQVTPCQDLPYWNGGILRSKAPSRGLWMRRAGSLWHKRAGVATPWKYLSSIKLSTNESTISTLPINESAPLCVTSQCLLLACFSRFKLEDRSGWRAAKSQVQQCRGLALIGRAMSSLGSHWSRAWCYASSRHAKYPPWHKDRWLPCTKRSYYWAPLCHKEPA